MRPEIRFSLLDSNIRQVDADSPYMQKIRALGLNPAFDYEIEVRHDDWCGALQGGWCSCDPDVLVVNGVRREP